MNKKQFDPSIWGSNIKLLENAANAVIFSNSIDIILGNKPKTEQELIQELELLIK